MDLTNNSSEPEGSQWEETFSLREESPLYERFINVDFDTNINKIKEMHLSNQYTFSDFFKTSTPKDQCKIDAVGGTAYVPAEERTILFTSKSDDSLKLYYMMSHDDTKEISIHWYVSNEFKNSEKFEEIKQFVQFTLIPDFINQLLKM